jgi:hypothetical protein
LLRRWGSGVVTAASLLNVRIFLRSTTGEAAEAAILRLAILREAKLMDADALIL